MKKSGQPAKSEYPANCDHRKRWGIVLAGGDGVRLREMTKFIHGDERPKQFCSLLGSSTLLETTQRRVERSIRSERILYSLTGSHREFFPEFLEDRLSQQVVQPCNRGTAPAIVSSLLEVARRDPDPDAVVAVLPSDHFISNQRSFTRSIEHAFAMATSQPESIVILSVPLNKFEPGYGWIEPGSEVGGSDEAFRVKEFQEKPSSETAEALLRRGALVNTFVMVGRVHTFLDMVAETSPGLLRAFLLEQESGGGILKPEALERIYAVLGTVDFSASVLTRVPDRLIALRHMDHGWSDLGVPDRVAEVILKWKRGRVPKWFSEWEYWRDPSGSPMPRGKHAV